MSSPLRIALIGAGNMGQQHYQHLKTLTEATLCAVADPGPQAAGTAGALSIPQLKRWHYLDADAGWHQPLQAVQEGFNADEALRLQLQHFVKVARGEAKPLVSVADAARTLALIEAIREAAASGRACVPARIEERT